MTGRDLDERIAVLREDLADVERQLVEGDIDADTANRLSNRYRGELARLEAEADTAPGPTPTDEGEPGPGPEASAAPRRRLSGRALVGVALVGVAIVVIGAFAVRSLDDGSGTGLEGIAGDAGSGSVDLSEITNEQMEAVIAENPDVIGMRLALARRYFEEGSFDLALDHYFEVLAREQNPEALANIGWMTYLSGRPDVAVGYLEAALQRDPDYLPARWFIANVLVDLGRADDAVAHLLVVLRADDVPDDVREGATRLLDQIEAGG